MENIYFNNIVRKKIIINPKHMGNIDNYIESYLKTNYEGKCIAEGYVKPETIKIVRRSIGTITGSRFTGDITYIVEYSAEICNPVIGNVIECKVKNINKLGLLCNNGPITVIVGKKFHDNLEDINKIKEGDSINVEIIAKKIQLNKEEIQVVGKIFSNKNTVIKKSVKKTMVNSDITSIDVDDVNQNNVIKNNADFSEEENDYENKEEDEEDEVSYGSEDDVSSNEDIDENMNFGDINIGENEEVGDVVVEDDEDIEDEGGIESDGEVKEYDYD